MINYSNQSWLLLNYNNYMVIQMDLLKVQYSNQKMKKQHQKIINLITIKGRGEPWRVSNYRSICCLWFVLFLFYRNLATVLVQRGVLKKGTILLAGQSVARVNFSIKKIEFIDVILSEFRSELYTMNEVFKSNVQH